MDLLVKHSTPFPHFLSLSLERNQWMKLEAGSEYKFWMPAKFAVRMLLLCLYCCSWDRHLFLQYLCFSISKHASCARESGIQMAVGSSVLLSEQQSSPFWSLWLFLIQDTYFCHTIKYFLDKELYVYCQGISFPPPCHTEAFPLYNKMPERTENSTVIWEILATWDIQIRFAEFSQWAWVLQGEKRGLCWGFSFSEKECLP